MTINYFLRISLITPSTMDWLWWSLLVMCRSISWFWTSLINSVPFEVWYLDPSQYRWSITQKFPVNSLSLCPDRIFSSMSYAASYKESLSNTCAQQLPSRELYRPTIVSMNIIPLMHVRLNMQLAMYRIEIGMMANWSIILVLAFSILVEAPSNI